MRRARALASLAIVALVGMAGCGALDGGAMSKAECEELGGTLQTFENPDGSTRAVCYVG
ncbi:MAG: hypothetical protein AAF547_25245 [Actinomycetota bacterium]